MRVSVPATSANLGPGFDALGLALDLRDVVTAQVTDGLEIIVDGADAVPLDETHLVHRSMVRAFEALEVPTPGLRLHCVNLIPHGRGLGSSSAAIVAGVAAARGLVEGGTERMDDDALFALAAEIEGHPDNVAPAVYGGFTIAYAEGGTFRATSIEVDPRVGVVMFVPANPVETKVARGLLPHVVSHADAAANAGRAALLVAALTRRPELLHDATRDWLHQDYREPAMPETLALVRSLRAQGFAAIVSGAGPTVLAFCAAEQADVVAAAGPAGWRVLRPAIDSEGLRVG
ncbi:MAG TPA: homoserine kinase [Nocardioidaceae bacterium]|nr:homoserine kinase [Nocardioidaceae bacterium]